MVGRGSSSAYCRFSIQSYNLGNGFSDIHGFTGLFAILSGLVQEAIIFRDFQAVEKINAIFYQNQKNSNINLLEKNKHAHD